GITKNSTSVTISALSTPPTHSTPIITPSAPNATSNLTCNWQNVQDINGDPVTNITVWYRNNRPTVSLYLPFEGADGKESTNATDYSGYGNNGTVFGATWNRTGGKVGGGYTFDGTNDYIAFPTSTAIDLVGASQGTIEFWMKPNKASTSTSATYTITGNFNSAVGDAFIFAFCGSDANCELSGLGTAGDIIFMTIDSVPTIQSRVRVSSANYAWNAGDWVHIALLWNDSQATNDLRIFINGTEPTNTNTNEGSLNIGALTLLPTWYVGDMAAVSIPFNGTIDEFKVYNYTLSASQISSNYENGLTRYPNKIISDEISLNDNWLCSVTPNDGYNDGIAKNSSSVTVALPATITSWSLILQDPDTEVLNDDDIYHAGTATYIYADDDDSGSWGDSYLMFNTSAIPSGMTIVSAVFRMHVNDADTWPTHDEDDIALGYGISNYTWNEETGAASTMRTLNGTNTINKTGLRIWHYSLSDWVGWDFTQWIRDEYSLQRNNITLGFYLADGSADTSDDYFAFDTKEHANESFRPYLYITYTNTTAPTTDTPTVSPQYPNTTSNLTCNWANTADANGDSVQNITVWHKNSAPALALYLPFEGGSDQVHAKDYSGHSLVGDVYGNPTWNSTVGKLGGAYLFDHNNSKVIEVVEPTRFNFTGGTSFTLEAWVKPSSSGENQGLIYKSEWDVSSPRGYRLWINGGDFAFSIGNGTEEVDVRDAVVNGVWKHFVGTYDSSTRQMKFYVNGTKVDNATAPGGDITTWNSVVIANSNDLGYPLNGTIDEVRIYNYSLSAEQVSANFQAGLAGRAPNIIVSSETASNDQWRCSVTPNDGYIDGITKNSTSVTVVSNVAPTHNLPTITPALPNITSNLTCNWNGVSDA
ncbi:MAG: LamG domain-containing protein, partial [Nanoarchaeota archaeon]|nr:LamG domain-containing protein [Nanoarchaeota archaeon]